MKKRTFLATIVLILASQLVNAQNKDKYSNATKTGFGIYPGIEAVNTPRNQNPAVFAPDFTYSFEDNQISLGPRLILSNTNNYSNATIPTTENSFGVGTGFRKFLTPSKTMFDWFVYYDMEYFNYDYHGSLFNSNNNYGNPINPEEWYKANTYNFVTGFGYHLHMVNHIYMSTLVGVGIGLEYGKNTYYMWDDVKKDNVLTYNTFSNKSLVGQFKLGIGYVF